LLAVDLQNGSNSLFFFDKRSILLPSLNTAAVVGVQQVQVGLLQAVRITLKLLLQRKDDVDEVDDVLIAHEGPNDTGSSSSSSQHPKRRRKLGLRNCPRTSNELNQFITVYNFSFDMKKAPEGA
jgi:hypothetical protein